MKDVYTLSDLEATDTLIHNGKVAKLAVIGDPIKHSKSPQLHQPALDALGIDCSYIRVHLEEAEFTKGVSRLREMGFHGCNVTVPHKLLALDYATELDPAAQILGAVNTLKFEGDQVSGYNTDGPGLSNAIKEHFGKNLSELNVLIIGAGGGAGRAVAAQCILEEVPNLYLQNRTASKIDALKEKFSSYTKTTLHGGTGFNISDLIRDREQIDLIINTTSLGLKESDPCPLPEGILSPKHFVYDSIYSPPETPLIKEAQKVGAQSANGFSMLIHQGALAFQHWFPGTSPLSFMKNR